MRTPFCAFIFTVAVFLVPRFASANCWFCYQGGCYEDPYSGRITCLPGPGNTCTMGPACGIAGCFLAGAVVETRFGPLPIEEIEVGDEVLGVDEAGNVTFSTASKVYRSLSDEYLLINGSISVTPSHPFWVGGAWVNAGELKVGDEFLQADNSPFVVTSVERISFGVRVYNIEVKGTHTFFVDGVLTHNKGPDPNG